MDDSYQNTSADQRRHALHNALELHLGAGGSVEELHEVLANVLAVQQAELLAAALQVSVAAAKLPPADERQLDAFGGADGFDLGGGPCGK